METEPGKGKQPPKILIVDDISVNVKILEKIVQAEGYEPLCALNVQKALQIMESEMPQLILSDVSMPGMNGLEFCKLLKSNPRTQDIPFIFITVADSSAEKQAAFEAGAVDFIPKPFERIEVIMRINNQLNSYRIKQEMEDYNRMMHKIVSEQKKQMQQEKGSVLLALAKILEKRDAYSGGHLARVADNCRILAQSLQLVPKYESSVTDEFIEIIGMAAKLHDIGYLIMPDLSVKEGESLAERKERTRRHIQEGVSILEELREDNASGSRYFDMAIDIAKYHHANWDGTGYPEGISGGDIPLAARITAVVNDFDILIQKKPKGELGLEESVRIINDRSGTVYDPRIIGVFNKVLKQVSTS